LGGEVSREKVLRRINYAYSPHIRCSFITAAPFT